MDARSQTPDRSTRADGLVDDLNTLLDVLALSSPTIRLEAPHDLTPSLILALLESMLRARLPIPQTTREARTKGARIDAMKIFLGVLEADVLQEEIGLSEVDPRRLANGEWEEVVCVGRVLVWVARRMGYLASSSSSNPPSPSLVHPPSPKPRRPPMHGPRDSITTTGTGTAESFTNVFVVRPRARYPPGSPIPSSHPSRTPSPVDDTTALGLSFDPPRVSSPPRLHEQEDEDEEDEEAHRRDDRSLVHEHEHEYEERTEPFCTCDTHTHTHDQASTASTYCTCPHDASSVRYDGWIERVDDIDLDAYTNTGMGSSRTPRAQRSRELQQLYPGAFIRASSSRAGSATPSTSRAGAAGPFTSRADSAAPRMSSSRAGSAAPRTSSSRAAPPLSISRAVSAAPSTTRAPSTSTLTSATRAPSRYSELTLGPGPRNPTRHVSPAQHTLALMNERARLLAELASVRAGSAKR
ncbi:hypothetical protein EXIGLDRAFT_735563 [Exidia glandulosa HHB12029]|uniref:DUF5745 domain-containing protein n=1 Tax=Exidia glandulosa HHB12029 TaxID=1314781 RepID=A0A165JSA2_EXIGL|nr:hypothetical protein EXIGLDRAFT_735563 [Exidia glandulosa HHB12029]